MLAGGKRGLAISKGYRIIKGQRKTILNLKFFFSIHLYWKYLNGHTMISDTPIITEHIYMSVNGKNRKLPGTCNVILQFIVRK